MKTCTTLFIWGKANEGKIPSRKSRVDLLFKKKKKEKLTPKCLALWETIPQYNGGKVSFTRKDRQIKNEK